jgi:TPR repeat protein
MVQLGEFYYTKQKDLEKSMMWLEQAIEKGNSMAMFKLGIILIKEKIDVDRGKQLILKAADENTVDAMCYIGKMLIAGFNIEGNVFRKDEQQGIQWLEKAIEQRDYRAMTVLGYHLIMVSPSNSELVKRGMNLLYRAAHAGWPKAMTKLGEVLCQELLSMLSKESIGLKKLCIMDILQLVISWESDCFMGWVIHRMKQQE